MTPYAHFIIEGHTPNNALMARLLSLSITDQSGIQSDTLSITLDDRDGTLVLPEKGAVIECWLGYKETNEVPMGRFILDEVEVSGMPQTLVLSAKAADMQAGFKTPKTRQWESVSVSDIVKTIAHEHHLEPKIAPPKGELGFAYLAQTEESDLHFLTRLGQTIHAVIKPAFGYLVCVAKGESKTLSGQALPEIHLSKKDILQYRMVQAERGKYKAVKAYYYHALFAEPQELMVGKGEPLYCIRHPYADEREAQSAASAKLALFQRGSASLSLTMLGQPALMAEGRCHIRGIREGINGVWQVERVQHRLDAQGFITTVEASVPSTIANH